jgi:glycosyltransferase involved in cell wall biosynthesis
LKVLQYMAAGLPVVTNPVGVHREMVRNGETGFLATSEGEWIEAVETLARDPELRRRMGARGRQLVEERYSVEAGAGLWVNLIAGQSAGRATA